MSTDKRSVVLTNLIWRFAERFGAQIVAFVVTIILARLLDPSDYGTISLITVFTTILQVFVDSGLGNALIQKKDADDIDFSSAFYTNILFCIFLYLLIFVAAPFIAAFYNNPVMAPMIRVLSITVLISGVKNVQQAYVSRNMLFKRFFFATLGGTIGAAIIGISMAYKGFGAWALIAQQVLNVGVDTVILWLTVKWRPKKVFSFQRLKSLFNYGWKILISRIIDTVYNNTQALIIGKMYSKADLAFYNKGNQLPYFFIANINSSIDSVLLPALSDEQDDRTRVKSMTRRSIKTSVYILAPMMIGMAFVSNTLVRVLLTEKWLPCVWYMRIFCLTYVFYPIHTSNLNAINALGRSDLFLKLEVEKKVVGLITLLIAMWWGVKAIAISLIPISIISQLINSGPNKKLLNYGYLEQLKDILPSIILSVIMGVCVIPVTYLNLPDLVTLALQVILGILVYIVGSIILKIDSFEYLYSFAIRLIKHTK